VDDVFGLVPGLRVETFDHRVAGTIEMIDGERILVRPRGRRPYWIGDVLVRSVDEDHATLHVNRRKLRGYRQPMDEDDDYQATGPFHARPFPIIASVMALGVGVLLMAAL